jgi:uncharacterized protein YeaO (DUF488 family)
VRKEDYARLDYFDVWLPELAPSAALVSCALSEPFTPKRWSIFDRRYQREMRQPAALRVIAAGAAISRIFQWAATVKARGAVIALL